MHPIFIFHQFTFILFTFDVQQNNRIVNSVMVRRMDGCAKKTLRTLFGFWILSMALKVSSLVNVNIIIVACNKQ